MAPAHVPRGPVFSVWFYWRGRFVFFFGFFFFGFEWLAPMSPAVMYLLYGIMAVAALFICLGLFYRIATVLFFLVFCYAELLDKTYYLNHYYLVTICSFLLIWV